MSRDVIGDLKRLEAYGIQMEPDYVLASPELLENQTAVEYLKKELMDLNFHEKQIPKVVRLLKNIVNAGQSQLLTVKKIPTSEAQRKLSDAGFSFVLTRTDNRYPPTSVSIQTKMGLVCISMNIPDLTILTDILNWGIPDEKS